MILLSRNKTQVPNIYKIIYKSKTISFLRNSINKTIGCKYHTQDLRYQKQELSPALDDLVFSSVKLPDSISVFGTDFYKKALKYGEQTDNFNYFNSLQPQDFLEHFSNGEKCRKQYENLLCDYFKKDPNFPRFYYTDSTSFYSESGKKSSFGKDKSRSLVEENDTAVCADLNNILAAFREKDRYSKNDLYALLKKINKSEAITKIPPKSILSFLYKLIYELRLFNTYKDRQPPNFVANFIISEIFSKNYHFNEIVIYNKLIEILGLLGDIESSNKIKIALSDGSCRYNFIPNSQTYSSLLSYFINRKLSSYFRDLSKFIKSLKPMYLERFKDLALPDPGEIQNPTEFSWAFNLYSEIIRKNVYMSVKLEKYLILTACTTSDFDLLFSLLKRNSAQSEFVSSNNTLFKYNQLNSALDIKSELSNTYSYIWRILNQKGPIQNVINKLDGIQTTSTSPQPTNYSGPIFEPHQFDIWYSQNQNHIQHPYTSLNQPELDLNQDDTFNILKNLDPYQFSLRNSNPLAIRDKDFMTKYKRIYIWLIKTLFTKNEWKSAYYYLQKMRYIFKDPPPESIYTFIIVNLSLKKELNMFLSVYEMMKKDIPSIRKGLFEIVIKGCMSKDKTISNQFAVARFSRFSGFKYPKFYEKTLISTDTVYYYVSEFLNFDKSFSHNHFSEILGSEHKLDIKKGNDVKLTPGSTLAENNRENGLKWYNIIDRIIKTVSFKDTEAFDRLYDNKFESAYSKDEYVLDEINDYLVFPKASLYFYDEFKLFFRQNNTNFIPLDPLNIDTVFYITEAIFSAPENEIFKRFHNLKRADFHAFISLLDKINFDLYSRISLFLDLFYNEIDPNLQNSCLSAITTSKLGSEKCEKILRLSKQSLKLFGFHSKAAEISTFARNTGYSI
ncbi:hypothetical protein BB560_007123 [Smittium megazygosporum]|uniref:Uncharacterized protein n=1 Tax=Smittium megazygosporum TaxID=133381 RepID=A0A2T9XYM5_9FUNG|nr:hypothetical protein BB560_007123 [Smittium megazygosporum]